MEDRKHEDISPLADQLCQASEQIKHEIAQRIIGQTELIEHLLITLFANGHALFVGVPGLAKTLLIQTLAEVLELGFNRIQFTPDLMPSDITGTEILELDEKTQKRNFQFKQGPVFCNLLLADEINRTPPKTQAALLQAMQERSVTSGGVTYELPLPFHVFATQNPIEQEGTYPLPEAQLDRFMCMLLLEYPSQEEEVHIAKLYTSALPEKLAKVMTPEQLMQYQDLVLHVPIADPVVKHAVQIIRNTRPESPQCPASLKPFIRYGAGPRAVQHLILAAKARALMKGRYAVDVEDIRALAYPILRHRIILSYQAEAQHINADALIETVLAEQKW